MIAIGGKSLETKTLAETDRRFRRLWGRLQWAIMGFNRPVRDNLESRFMAVWRRRVNQ